MRARPIQSIALSVLALAILSASALRLGLVPPRLNPLAPLSLREPSPWFLDYRLSALRRDQTACRAVLQAPVIWAEPVSDQPVRNGCGWHNAVQVASAGGVKAPVGTLTCEMAAALAMWLEHSVQPAAIEHFGQGVASLQHMGAYACRNIAGNNPWTSHRSQHATANAIDIAGFTLDDGRVIRVLKDWKGDGPDARFLHDVHKSACRYFRAALSPRFNEAHASHLHLDRGLYTSCR